MSPHGDQQSVCQIMESQISTFPTICIDKFAKDYTDIHFHTNL